MSVNNVAFPGRLVIKTSLPLPQTATATLFTQSGGSLLVTGLLGLVTTATGATATNLSLGTSGTGGSNTSIVPATAIASKTVGTWIVPQFAPTTGIAAAPFLLAGGVAFLSISGNQLSTPFVLGSGNSINWTTSASDTGAISWYLWYIPIDADSGLS